MPRTTIVHLLSGDYPDRLATLGAAALEAREDKTPLTALEQHPYDILQADFNALRLEAIEAGITVEMVAVGRKVWRELKEKHPPRPEGDGVDADTAHGDRLAGVNTDSVEDDLVRASVTSPEFNSRDAFDEWADSLSEGEWQVLVQRAWELANGARVDPKELPSLPTRSDD